MKKYLSFLLLFSVTLLATGCIDYTTMFNEIKELLAEEQENSNGSNTGNGNTIILNTTEEVTGFKITYNATGLKDGSDMGLVSDADMLADILAIEGLKASLQNIFTGWSGTSAEEKRNLFVATDKINSVLAYNGTPIDINLDKDNPNAFIWKMKLNVYLTDMEAGPDLGAGEDSGNGHTDDAGVDGGKRIDIYITPRETETFDQIVFLYSPSFYPLGVESNLSTLKKEFNDFLSKMYQFYFPDSENSDDDDFIDGVSGLDIFRPDPYFNATKYLNDSQVQSLLTQYVTAKTTLTSPFSRNGEYAKVPITITIEGIESRSEIGAVVANAIDTLVINIAPRSTEKALPLTSYDLTHKPAGSGIVASQTTGAIALTDAVVSSNLVVEVDKGTVSENGSHSTTDGYTYFQIVELVKSQIEEAITDASYSDLTIAVAYDNMDLVNIPPDGASSRIDSGESHSITYTMTLTPGFESVTGNTNTFGTFTQWTIPSHLKTQSFEVVIQNIR